MGLRLGYYYHVPACLDDGRITMPGYQGIFIDSLASLCEKVTCFLHTPVPQDHFTGDYPIKHKNVELVDIGPHSSVPNRTIFAHRFVEPLKQRRNELDTIILRGLSPLLPAFANAAGTLPLVLLVVNDYLAGVDDLPQPAWRKELIRLWSRWNLAQTRMVARRSLTFVNSHALFEQYKSVATQLIETRTTTLRQDDFFQREETCQQPPYRLLYTGRMDRSKGLLDIVNALAIVVEDGYDCSLDLVGMKIKGDPILQEIQKQAEYLDISKRIVYHGYKPLGQSLFDYYRRSDIYIIASQAFEGFPRTIWEAMANSLPVIATRVSSIPAFIDGSAELIEPRNPEALAQAIIKLIKNPQLRRQLITSGLNLARNNTIDVQTQTMVRQIESWLKNYAG